MHAGCAFTSIILHRISILAMADNKSDVSGRVTGDYCFGAMTNAWHISSIMLYRERGWLLAGFVGGAFAEIFGGGPVINQLASAPQAVLLTTLLVAAGSCVPAIKVRPQLTHLPVRTSPYSSACSCCCVLKKSFTSLSTSHN